MAAEIRGKYPSVNIQMIPSGKGRFEVTYNGQPIFEKSKLDRHARPGEILSLLDARESHPAP